MNTYRLLILILIIGVLLSACSDPDDQPVRAADTLPAAVVRTEADGRPSSNHVNQADETAALQPAGPRGDQTHLSWPDGEAQSDDQGAVDVAVTPLDLNAPDGSLNFSVGLNTHSVDLSMDLAQLAILEADNGLSVQATLWDAPRGGHHVSGVLSFPATSNGTTLLKGASHLTLTIYSVDAPERIFTWSLTG